MFPLQLRHHFQRASGENKSSSSLWPQEIIFSSFVFRRSITSQVFCSMSLQAFGSPVFILHLYGSNTGAHDVLCRAFAPDLSIAQKPIISSDPVHKSRHSHHRLSLSPSRTLKHMGASPSFRTLLQPLLQSLCWFRFSHKKLSSFCFGSSSRFNLSSHGGTFFFPEVSLPVM